MLARLGADIQDVLNAAQALADPTSGVQSIRVDTAWLPPITSEAPLAGPPSPILTWLKPQITVTYSTGKSFTAAPYGPPGESRWPLLAAGLMVAGALGALWAIRKLSR
jgi:hypothetical protein